MSTSTKEKTTGLVKKRIRLHNEGKYDVVEVRNVKRRKRDVQRTYPSKRKSSAKIKSSSQETVEDNDSHEYEENASYDNSSQPSTSRAESVNTLPKKAPEIKLEKQVHDNAMQYRKYLKENEAIVPVCENYTAFLMQDWNKNSPKDNYVVLQRKPVVSGKEEGWVYLCSCNISRSRIVSGLPNSSDSDSIKVLDEKYPPCTHIEVAVPLLKSFDSSKSITPQIVETKQHSSYELDHDYNPFNKNLQKSEIYTIQADDSVVCVKDGTTQCPLSMYSIIRVKYTCTPVKLQCTKYSCRFLKTKCSHVEFVESSLCDIPPELSRLSGALNKISKQRNRYVPASVSTQKRSFAKVAPEKAKTEVHSGVPAIDGKCICGNKWSESVEIYDTVKVFYTRHIDELQVYQRLCSSKVCTEVKLYDGYEDDILNMVSFLVSHDVLYDYMKQFVTEGTTVNSFYKEWTWKQIEAGNTDFTSLLSYSRFLHSWYNFVKLLDIDYRQAFACPECGDTPDNVIMDGVALGVKKEFLKWKTFMTEEKNPDEQQLEGR